jgi:hypothetical protein
MGHPMRYHMVLSNSHGKSHVDSVEQTEYHKLSYGISHRVNGLLESILRLSSNDLRNDFPTVRPKSRQQNVS